MTSKYVLTKAEARARLSLSCKTVLRELIAAEETYKVLLDAQDGALAINWSAELDGLADTGVVTLGIDVAGLDAIVFCATGANFFSAFDIGRDAILSNFTSAGNNLTSEIKARTNDSITLTGKAGMSEVALGSDIACRARQKATTEQLEEVDGMISASDALHELYLGGDGTVTTSTDLFDRIRDFAI